MRRILPFIIVSVTLSGCQSFFPIAAINATPSTDVPDAPAPKKAAPSKPVPPRETEAAASAGKTPDSSPPRDAFRPVTVTAETVADGLIIPVPTTNDVAAGELDSERERINAAIRSGSMTREAGAKRLYRLAGKSGTIKGKADEELWLSLIQAYRNLDDRYISFEDAASDIDAAFRQRRAAP